MDSNKITDLMKAASAGDLARVRALLAAGADINAADIFGNTALLYAVLEGQDAVVRALLEAGADPQAKNQIGVTPLSAAKARGVNVDSWSGRKAEHQLLPATGAGAEKPEPETKPAPKREKIKPSDRPKGELRTFEDWEQFYSKKGHREGS